MHFAIEAMASDGLRVVAVAARSGVVLKTQYTRKELEHHMVLIGVIGILDPPREESAPSVSRCHDAGIIVRMLTGDHAFTAKSISRMLNILSPGDDAVLARDFEQCLDTDHIPVVVARCSPATKVAMVQALRSKGHVVAMTGDGVNDAPALKVANVGVAMGSGSEVTKNAADIVLTDDSFRSLVDAVAEGRRMFANTRKFVVYMLAGNVASTVVLMLGLSFRDAAGLAVFPLTALQILWMNTVVVAAPGIGLAGEEAEADCMLKAPRKNQRSLDAETIADMIVYGVISGGLTLAAFALSVYWIGNAAFGLGCNHALESCEVVYRGRSAAFLTMGLTLLLNAYNCRFSSAHFWQKNIWANKMLLLLLLSRLRRWYCLYMSRC
eukprot:TRINITY_DN3001_c0_g2_i3.p1 TRINITY_DN3001_c0_g2~~TRINITY_DN3001_c0_g2_i3.p1  ORF type:complete len:381 (-),score=82.07 TRINITY_DN3001_c0_g2_i3:322-1464(-)